MEQYIGFDVSTKETATSIRQDGKRIWRGKVRIRPATARGGDPQALPVICIEARNAKAAFDMAANKTDAKDADGMGPKNLLFSLSVISRSSLTNPEKQTNDGGRFSLSTSGLAALAKANVSVLSLSLLQRYGRAMAVAAMLPISFGG
ncbi:hypothetical protein HNQ96_003869 [Aminobacter lissarensis]|uniref:Transposase n=1 Tax=Aminobacter carboxidus TaxID=376165 RepID=A0A8E1WFQ4_9HYPH|nr:hypothetical protein [Aminobacter lissarensis]